MAQRINCVMVNVSMDIFDNSYFEEPFFPLDAVGVAWLCCPAFALEVIQQPRGTGRLAHPPSGAALLSHGRCQVAQLSRANCCLHLHCFPTCSQDSSGCLILCCLSARCSTWSWGCDLVRLPSRESWKEMPTLTGPELISETVKPKC